MFHAERAEVQRNRYYSPRSTAWASEGEPFDDRLSDIANRYGKDSGVRTIPWTSLSDQSLA